MKTTTVETCEIESRLKNAASLACRWLTDVSQIKQKRLEDEPGNKTAKFLYDDWRGAMGEYTQAGQYWWFLCPVWHTGQAVVALVRAAETLNEPALLDAARYSADFIMRNRETNEGHDDFGMILAYEDYADMVNVSAINESLVGLLAISEATGDKSYFDAARDAARWVVRKAYDAENKMLRDVYSPASREFKYDTAFGAKGRPLADDAVLLTIGTKCGDEEMLNAFWRILERLIQDEGPPGNWIDYSPCNREIGNIHPRHAYWWGMPFLDAYAVSGDVRYLDVAIRAGQWYVKAMRRDGGLFRHTYSDFGTPSFGHATSGVACAIILLTRLWQVTGKAEWIEPVARGLKFCMQMQMTNPADPNLVGAIIEKVNQPDGTDRSPYVARDLGSIFFIRAVCEVISAGLVRHLGNI